MHGGAIAESALPIGTPFSRLHAIVSHDWEPVCTRFWLRVVNDVLLTALDPGTRTDAWPSVQTRILPGLLSSSSSSSLSELSEQTRGKGKGKGSLALALQHREERFLESMRGLCTSQQLMEPLRELANCDQTMALELWEQGFKLAWSALRSSEQAKLVGPMVSLLSADCHNRIVHVPGAAGYHLSSVGCLLRSFASARPQPRLPPELVRWLGKTFNMWHDAAFLCERRVLGRLLTITATALSLGLGLCLGLSLSLS